MTNQLKSAFTTLDVVDIGWDYDADMHSLDVIKLDHACWGWMAERNIVPLIQIKYRPFEMYGFGKTVPLPNGMKASANVFSQEIEHLYFSFNDESDALQFRICFGGELVDLNGEDE